jgi:hypothetical protein
MASTASADRAQLGSPDQDLLARLTGNEDPETLLQELLNRRRAFHTVDSIVRGGSQVRIRQRWLAEWIRQLKTRQLPSFKLQQLQIPEEDIPFDISDWMRPVALEESSLSSTGQPSHESERLLRLGKTTERSALNAMSVMDDETTDHLVESALQVRTMHICGIAGAIHASLVPSMRALVVRAMSKADLPGHGTEACSMLRHHPHAPYMHRALFQFYLPFLSIFPTRFTWGSVEQYPIVSPCTSLK